MADLKTAALVLVLATLTGCGAVVRYARPPRGDEGDLQVYAAAWPKEASRLSVTLRAVSAVRDDGTEVALSLALPTLTAGELDRQRLLMEGRLPAGTYQGLSFEVAGATLEGPQGRAALLLPPRPERVAFPFQVTRRGAGMLSLSLRYDQAVAEGIRFRPAFTITAPPKPVPGVAGYVTNAESDTLTVFDKQAGAVVGAIATGRTPRGLALDARRGRAYVALSGDDALDVVDTLAGEVMQRVTLHPGDAPEQVVLAADGRTLLVLDPGSKTLSFVDTTTLLEVSRVRTGGGPCLLKLSRDGKRAFVLNGQDGTASVFDVAQRALITLLAVDPGACAADFNARGDVLYVASETGSYVSLFDPLGLTLRRKLYAGLGITALKVDTVTDLLYASKRNAPHVTVYEPFSLAEIGSLRAAGGGGAMTIEPDSSGLYVVDPEGRIVTSVSLVSGQILSQLDVGDGPYWVSVAGER